MQVIDAEIRARERANNSGKPNNGSYPIRGSTRNIPTSATLLSNDSPMPKCSYCRQQHSSNSCKSVTDPSERKQILRRTGRCFVCLRKHHTSQECRSTLKCTRCNGRHHVSICVAAQGQASSVATTNTNNDDRQRQATEQQQPLSTTNQNTPTTTALQCTNAKVPVLLQTARARVFKVGSPKATREVRIIFDSGSQRSYITSNVKKLLNLDSKFTETMLIKTFGSTKNGKLTCDVVSIGILLKDGGMLELSLLTVPLICEPLCGQPISCISENYEYKSRLELADHSYGEDKLNVDMLIGSDQYWNLVRNWQRDLQGYWTHSCPY